MRRALLCQCGCHLEACLDEEELVSEVLVHLGREHPMMEQQQEAHQQQAQVHERVATHS